MQGTYNLYLDGDLVAKHKNIITDQGKERVRQLLAGKVPNFASSIAVGIGEDTPASTDARLVFNVDSADILATMVDSANNQVIYKTALPANNEYIIFELGCYASNAASQSVAQSSLIMSFNESSIWTDITGSHTMDNTFTRLGAYSIKYAITAGSTVVGSSPINLNISQLQDSTLFSIAHYASNLASMKIRFKNTAADYWEGTITGIINNDYNVSTIAKSAFVPVGTPSWDSITTLEVVATASSTNGTIYLDGIRYDSIGNTNPLLSRSAASDPLIKPAGSTLDIEYVLEGIV